MAKLDELSNLVNDQIARRLVQEASGAVLEHAREVTPQAWVDAKDMLVGSEESDRRQDIGVEIIWTTAF